MYCQGQSGKSHAMVYTRLFHCTSFCELFIVPPRSKVTAVKQHQMWKNLKTLQRSLLIKKNVNSWRVAPTHFRVEEGWLKPGSVSMSPAWFQQAHEVCTNRLVIWFSLTNLYRNPMSLRFPRRLPRHIPQHGWRCK